MRQRRVALATIGALCAVVMTACSHGSDAGGEKSGPSSQASKSATPARPTARLELGLPFDRSSDGATFTPRDPGARVLIQVQRDQGWRTVRSGRQDATGRFDFDPAKDAAAGRYRAVTVPSGGGARVVSAPVEYTAWHQIWGDEFDGDALDPGNWQTRLQPATGRRLCATPDPDLVRVDDGHAVLGIKRIGKPTSQCPHGVFTNAMIGTGEGTSPGFQATYGLFAARVKFQSGNGQHGSFWMQTSEANGAEIDVAEYFGDGRSDGGVSNFVHSTSADGAVTSVGGVRPKVRRLLGTGVTPASSWHVWSVEWSPEGYVFRVDDHVTMRTTKSTVATKEFLVLSLLTSDFELQALNTTRSTMKVDWVRAWQQ